MKRRRRGLPGLGIGAFMRARFRRRLFVWFGLTIGISFAVVSGTMHVLGAGGNAWRREVQRGHALVSHLFEQSWSRPTERDALARTLGADLDVDVTLVDAQGAPLLVVGRPCPKPLFTSPVNVNGAVAGHVQLCAGRERAGGGFRTALAIAAAAAVLWAISGRVARRLARPFDELSQLADALGRGQLDARIRQRCEGDGETAMVARVLNDMAARIERQLADQRELLAAVSHEIRTPIARIRILTELARPLDGGAPAVPGLSETAHANLDEIDREIMEIDALVSELLASARVDFAAAKPTKLDVADVARRALERSAIEGAELVLDATHVHADPTLLARALANLLENAKRHGGGVARLRVVANDAKVRFEVEDRGPGIQPGDEEKIFESFHQRADESIREKGSLGLGLALVRRIAEAHGGRAYARNCDASEGGGACVGIELPLAPPHDEV